MIIHSMLLFKWQYSSLLQWCHQFLHVSNHCSHDYRPQTKFWKVIFLQVSFCPQGGGCIPACTGRRGCLPRGGYAGGGCVCLGGYLHRRGVSTPEGGVCPGGKVSVQGGVNPLGTRGWQPPPHWDQRQTPHLGPEADNPPPGYYGMRSTSGRYASHWNAFLFRN